MNSTSTFDLSFLSRLRVADVVRELAEELVQVGITFSGYTSLILTDNTFMEHSLPSICIAFFQFCRSCAGVVVVLVAEAVEEIAAVRQCLCESFQFQLLLLLEVFRLPFALSRAALCAVHAGPQKVLLEEVSSLFTCSLFAGFDTQCFQN